MLVIKWPWGAGLACLIGMVYPMINLMKNTGLSHSAWRIGSKIAWRVRIGGLDQSGGPNGDRAVRTDRQLRSGGRNGSATIVY